MAGASDYLENRLLDLVLNAVPFTPPAALYVSLHTANPGETGANEVASGGYGRRLATFTNAAAGESETDAAVVFVNMPQVTVTHVGIWDALTGGNILLSDALVSVKALSSGDSFEFDPGALEVRLD